MLSYYKFPHLDHLDNIEGLESVKLVMGLGEGERGVFEAPKNRRDIDWLEEEVRKLVNREGKEVKVECVVGHV